MNIIVIQDQIFLPAYNVAADDAVCRMLETRFPAFGIVPVLCNDLAVKAGVLHCAKLEFFKVKSLGRVQLMTIYEKRAGRYI